MKPSPTHAEPNALFRETFRHAHLAAQRQLGTSISRGDGGLRAMLLYCLRHQTNSEYPFVFKYSFCRRKSDARSIRELTGAVHLLQSSGFVTDDIFDQTPVRYGADAVHIRYGADNAFIAGTLMQTIALETISRELENGEFANSQRVMTIFNQIIRELFVGQYLDIYNSGKLRVSESAYTRVIALGVGRYFGHVAKCGALLAKRSAAHVRAYTSFGYHYGMAVFITDDILDIVEKPKRLGMVAGSDLMNRRMRLPLLHALQSVDARGKAELREFVAQHGASRRQYDRIARLIANSGAMETCRVAAQKHVQASLRALRLLPVCHGVRMLEWLAETLMQAQGLGE